MTSCDRDNGSLCLVCLATLPTLDLSNTVDDSPLGDGCLGSAEQRAATSGSKKNLQRISTTMSTDSAKTKCCFVLCVCLFPPDIAGRRNGDVVYCEKYFERTTSI